MTEPAATAVSLLPADWSTVEVFGNFVEVDGSPAAGTITFAANYRLRSAATDTAILPSSITITLDAYGHFDAQIPATDDPDITPPGWAWEITETFGTYRRTYNAYLPASAVAVDLTGVATLETPPDPDPIRQLVYSVNNTPPGPDGNVFVAAVDSVNNIAPDTGGNITLTASSVGAATTTHQHGAADITSGTLNISRIPTGTTSSTVALGNHTHTTYAPLVDPTFTGTVTAPRLVRPATTLSDTTTITPDASTGDHQRVTIAGNRTLAAPTNGQDTQRMLVEVLASGAQRTLTLSGLNLTVGITSPIAIPSGKRLFLLLVNIAAAGWFVLASSTQS